jgi:hypothetical protein
MEPSIIIRQAIALARDGDKPQARSLIVEVLQNDPSNVDAWVVMAQIVDAPEEAIACMRKAVELRPEDEHARRYLEYLQKQNPPENAPETVSDPSTVSPILVGAGLALMALLCIIGLLLSGVIPLGGAASAATPSTISCRELIDQVLKISDDHCQHIDRDQVCYGHTTMKASLRTGALGRFEQTGDVLAINTVAHLSAAPLDLNTRDWGVGIFKIQANLPYTMPGELVTMVVVGDTSVENPSGSMEVFTFSSGISGIDCETVPVNGLVVRMPDGTGLRFRVNGSELALSGDAFLQAEANGKMQVSMLDGGGWISSKGTSRFFRARETASVPLAGLTADGAPTVGPSPQGELCALFGTCGTNNPTQSSEQSIALIQTAVTESAGSTPVSTQGAGAAAPAALTSTPAPVDPRLPTNTPAPLDPRIPTNTPVPVAPGMPTNTSVPLPTNTSAPRPTNTPGPAATSKPGSAATSTMGVVATNTSAPVVTYTPSQTNTAAPQPSNTAKPPTGTPSPTATHTPVPPTDTPIPVVVVVPTPAPDCGHITPGGPALSGSSMTLDLANTNTSDVAITHIAIDWTPTAVELARIKLGTSAMWNGTNVTPPASIDVSKKNTISAGSTGSLVFSFSGNPDSSGVTVTLTFDIGCDVGPLAP